MSPSPSTNTSSLDLSLPASQLLREGTKLAHAKAEHSAGAKALARGELDLSEYIRYLAIVWQVYFVLETELDRRADHPMLKPSYRPDVIWRSKAIQADIEYLTTLLRGQNTTQDDKASHPIVDIPGSPRTRIPFSVPPFLRPLFVTIPEQITSYQTRIVDLSTSNPELLLAHAYVRYFGDLSGGQIIAAKVKKMYSLPGDKGTEFYEFEQQTKPDPVTGLVPSKFEQKEHVNQIKDRYRTGIDVPVGDDEELKSRLVDEAIVAFDLAHSIFTLLPPGPSSSSKSLPRSGATANVQVEQHIISPVWKYIAFLVAVLVAHLGMSLSGVGGLELYKVLGRAVQGWAGIRQELD